jgi:hypothetical protein
MQGNASMGTRFTLCAVLVACVIACGTKASSSKDDDSTNGGSGATDVSGGGAATGGGGSGNGGGGGAAAGNGAVIVFNEVLAVGSTEWIEIVNPGSAAIDVSDYMIAGSDKDNLTEPKMGSALKFPAGYKIDAGGRVIIITSRAKEEAGGPYTRESCLPDGPDTCFYASFGVSATTGESLHFLAPDGTVISSTAIPMSLSADAGGSTSSSHCRLPDLTGEFATCALTPGQPNRAP